MVNACGAGLAMCAGMRVQTALPVIWRESLRACVEGVAASAKPGESACSGDNGHERPRDTHRKTPRPAVEHVCQGGTKAHDPFRDGPRLNPAFVTQLLGQAMIDTERPAPRLVYGDAAAKDAPVFDARF
jgi:hypothetical protein